MKYFVLTFVFQIILTSCGGESDKSIARKTDSVSNKDTIKVEVVSQIENNLPDSKEGFWIINVAASETEEEAIVEVKKLREIDSLYGYLWIPDYSTLSGKELFAVFKGPYDYETACAIALFEYQKTNPKAYAVYVNSTDKPRKTIYNKFDFRVDNKRMNLVLIYQSPEDLENYTGEDWGWFSSEIMTYMTKYNKDIEQKTVYGGWYSKADIKKLKNELDLEGLGYLCINKKGDKLFIPHDLPPSIVSSMCAFFEYGCEEPLYPE